MPSQASRTHVRFRNPQDSPLYKIVLDELETFLTRAHGDQSRPSARVENSLRAFLECGIPRFGVVRFGCKDCKEDLFVPFSCKKRIACLSCDAKRAVAESALAMEGLLPAAPYRQWVLVMPKRLRYFVHHTPALVNEISRILAEVLDRYYCSRTACGSKSGATAQMHVIQRFGSKVNLHEHVHSVVSDGTFIGEGGIIRFLPAPEPAEEELAGLSRELRQRIVKRMLKLGAIPEETGRELLARKHGGFSLNGKVRIEAEDRPALERLLRYFLRPALTPQRLTYDPEREVVRYRPKKGPPGFREVVEWKPLEFLRRFASLIPPPKLHLVRYYGALGPRSRLRGAVTWAAREKIPAEELLAGVPYSGVAGVVASANRECQKAISAACRAWAACLRRVFEIDPLACPSCESAMVPMAVIVQDSELKRLLKHLGLPIEFEPTKPARPPPPVPPEFILNLDEDVSQLNPLADVWDGWDEPPGACRRPVPRRL